MGGGGAAVSFKSSQCSITITRSSCVAPETVGAASQHCEVSDSAHSDMHEWSLYVMRKVTISQR